MRLAYFDVSMSQIACPASLGLPPPVGLRRETALAGEENVNRWVRIVGIGILHETLVAAVVVSQTTQNSQATGPYALIGIMRALDERHTVDLDAGYIRHLEWHRKVKDPFSWYSYLVLASTER